MSRLINKRKQIDPKTFRKHSRIAEKAAEPVLVVGPRDRTDYGYKIPGTSTKNFETSFMCISGGFSTPEWLHSKKTRIFRVLSGTGIFRKVLALTEEDLANNVQNHYSDLAVTSGDEFTANPGDTYCVVANTKLDLFVSQDSKYDANLQEITPVSKVADVFPDDLNTLTSVDKTLMYNRPPRRNNSKAREQIASLRGEVRQTTQKESGNPENFFRNSAEGLNAMPILRFDEEGAG